MASSSNSVSPSSQSWKYDVFVSFRGEDTRKTFVDHLYLALVQQGIHTYKDDVTLARGESIGPSLFKAIEESHIAIIVFSENYPDSSWCLDELAHIMKCRDERGQIVMPIFYHVNPSDMRKQNENFAKCFPDSMSKVETWRKALVDATNISGWVIEHLANGQEAEGVKQIVNIVSDNLFPLISNVNENYIGIRTRLQELKSKLEVELGGVRMIGIWGIGGGGKTTLASSIYHEISRKYDGCCFVDNIRENSSKYGMKILQEKVLSDVLNKKGMTVRSVEEGRHLIKSRLCRINVLIVLDDVDHLDQLNMLAGSHDWFGEGSRIIITTRDIHLLNAHKVKAIYNIRLLNDDEAIKLFCKHAPRLDHMHVEDYVSLSKRVVCYASGLPLALKVLGSFLCDKEIHEWMSAFMRLKDIPEEDIIGKLKISYDGLTPMEKELFLDIACFHRGIMINEAIVRLDACGFHPVIGIKVLIQKSLITIKKDRASFARLFDMHDLVQEMGHYIVHGKHANYPEKHSRVWHDKDIISICPLNSTMYNEKIEALSLETSYMDCPQHVLQVVATMKNLRSIYWGSFPPSLLPTNFQPTKLCYLILKYSKQKQLWKGYKNLPKLKLLDLSFSENLIKTPDVSGLPCLERMILRCCFGLREIHPSIGCHEKLAFLNLNGCVRLKKFPSITRMPKLATILLSGCTDMFSRQRQAKVPPVSLDYLRFPDLPRFLTRLSLTSFNLENGDNPSHINELSSLQVLDLSDNPFSRVSFNLVQLPRLKYLKISKCKSLVELPELPSSIAVLDADECDSLKITGDFPTTYKCLWKTAIGYKVRGGGNILRSMFQGNAIAEDHFMSFKIYDYGVATGLRFDISRDLGFDILTRSFVSYETLTLQLPWNWYTDYSGFLICFTKAGDTNMRIFIKQAMHTDDLHYHLDRHDIIALKSMCYIPFSSMMQKPLWKGTISFFISQREYKVELVPRRSEGPTVRSTDCSEFWDDEQMRDRKTFIVEHTSGTSVQVTWIHGSVW